MMLNFMFRRQAWDFMPFYDCFDRVRLYEFSFSDKILNSLTMFCWRSRVWLKNNFGVFT